jgi:hypothetical protein
VLPASLIAAAIVPIFPLALVIDYGGIGKGTPANGKTHRLRVVITCTNEDGVDSDSEGRRLADPKELHFELASTLRGMRKWSFYEQGMTLVIVSYDGSPVKKVEITSNGPKPTWRWVARP